MGGGGTRISELFFYIFTANPNLKYFYFMEGGEDGGLE